MSIKLKGICLVNLGYLFRPTCCGYYCLKYILGKVKCYKSYMSIKEISDVLKKYNYSCICVRVKGVEDIKFECISLIKVGENGFHYVVLKKIKGDYVFFYDPLFLFIRKMKVSVFCKKWSKICLFYTKV